MKHHRLVFAVAAALVVTSFAPRTVSAQATAPGLWPDRPLEPAEQQLKDAVIVLRDSLRAVLATSSRIERASASGSPAVLSSSARVLSTDCARAARAAGRAQETIKGFSTSEKRGDDALQNYRASLLGLQQEMTACSAQTAEAAGSTVDDARLTKVRANARKATDNYERSMKALMKTLSIRVDPLGYKSAIES